MSNRLVDVFDDSGAKLFTYGIALEEQDCLDAEFEEVAMIFAESSGLVEADELPFLRARCACEPEPGIAEPLTLSSKPTHSKGKIVSLVKRRMSIMGHQQAPRTARRAS